MTSPSEVNTVHPLPLITSDLIQTVNISLVDDEYGPELPIIDDFGCILAIKSRRILACLSMIDDDGMQISLYIYILENIFTCL